MKYRAQYEERSGWPWWLHGLILLCVGAAWGPALPSLLGGGGDGSEAMSFEVAVLCVLLGVAIPAFLYGLFGQLRVRLMQEEVDISWGLSEVVRKKISYAKIQKAEAVTYRPIGDFMGWGIRMGMGKKLAWTIRGNRALLLHLEDGTRFYLGSNHPERLLLQLQAVAKGKMGGAATPDEKEGQ